MATIAEFTVSAEDDPFAAVFEALPEATIELERIVPTSTGAFPYFWVRDVDASRVESLLEDHHAMLSVELIDQLENATLFRVEWNDGQEGLVRCISDSDVTLLSGIGEAGEWTFKIRADDAEAVSAFRKRCKRLGIAIDLRCLHSLADAEFQNEYDLTDEQREALVLAYEEGYFNTPRETTLEELATTLGITRPSFSSRLQRAIQKVVSDGFVRQTH